MPPRRFKKKSVRKIVEKRVAKAIEKYEKTRADSNNVGRSGSTNTGGTVVPEMHGCLYQTFMNGKPHSFNGGPEGCSRKKTETVGLKKMEQVFEICNCAEDDKVKFALVQSRRGSCSNLGWTGNCSRFGDLLMANQFLDLLKQQKIEKVHSLISAKESKETSLLQSLRPCMRQSTWPVNWSSNQFRPSFADKIFGSGNLPKCNRCNLHHHGPCPQKCQRCQRIGHMEKDCRVRLQGAAYHRLFMKEDGPYYSLNGKILEVHKEDSGQKKDLCFICMLYQADEKKLDDIRVVPSTSLNGISQDNLLALSLLCER
ncbi:putative reverse transcriptase domain-containing protein [Tanacetum coccineum]